MGRLGIAILLALVWAISGEAFAFSHKTVRYPRVYGATGRPYDGWSSTLLRGTSQGCERCQIQF